MEEEKSSHFSNPKTVHQSEAAPSETNDAPSARRRALKMLVASGAVAGAPATWHKPVIDSVLLPAHAQSSPSGSPDPCGDGGPCTSGMNVNILFAELVGGGDVIVVGDTRIPADQGCGLGDSDTSPTWTPPQLVCALLDENGLITETSFSSAGGGCNTSPGTATVSGCLVSCSVVVASGDHGLSSGDCVTLRFTFAGGCVCSGVTTVS